METTRQTRRFTPVDGVVIVAAVIAAAVAASLVISVPIRVGPVTLSARMAFGPYGETTVKVPPFGQATARTHAGPARVVVTVENVDLSAVERLIDRRARQTDRLPTFKPAGDDGTVTDVIEAETRASTSRLVGLALAVAALSAALAAFIAFALRRRTGIVVAAASAAFSAVVLFALIGVATFDLGALSEPQLEGLLAYVPQLETVFTTRLSTIERLRDQVSDVAEQIAAYYADPRSIAAGGGLPDTYRVLHVTDTHLDPVGAELARSLVRSYDASLVIDTGDLVITGASEEVRLLPSLVVTSVPVVYVGGNHDTDAATRALRALGNVTVATSETVVADGLRIFPLPDPQSASPAIEPSRAEVRQATEQAAERLRTLETAGLPGPDIIALHNPLAERELTGLAPLVLSGHTHSERLYISDGTVRLNSGTLGGMPYDPEKSDRSRLPHSASVLYYTADLPRRLIAVDRISVTPERTTTVTRHVIDESLLP